MHYLHGHLKLPTCVTRHNFLHNIKSVLFFRKQQASNGHISPTKQFPELGTTLSRFTRKELGEQDQYPKKPMFTQDFQQILDNIGLETPAALQHKWIK